MQPQIKKMEQAKQGLNGEDDNSDDFELYQARKGGSLQS
jgi:hypothetical protein